MGCWGNVYNPLGRVVQQTSGNGTVTLYGYGINNRRETVFDGSETPITTELYANDQMFAYYHVADGTMSYRYQNQVGTESAREHGGVITTYASLPYSDAPGTHQTGQPGGTSGEDDDQAHFAGMDVSIKTQPWQQSSFSHARFRELYSAGGQWMSPDPSNGSYDVGDPQSFNRYAYVLNNPLSMQDPDGLDSSGGVCYLTASNCGAGGGGGGVGGGGTGLGSFQMFANASWTMSSSTVTEYYHGDLRTREITTYIYSGINYFLLMASQGYVSGSGGGGGGAPNNGPTCGVSASSLKTQRFSRTKMFRENQSHMVVTS